MAKSKKITIFKPNWYGFDHKAVTKKFEGNPVFVNDFCVNSEYSPVAVYKSKKPNREKGHKDYMLLQTDRQDSYVRGMNADEIEKFRYQEAVHCFDCNTIVYSVMRHDMRGCKCGKVSVDGGRDYTKINFEQDSRYETVILDLLTDTFKCK